MAKPLRLEFAGAIYHVTARGNERRDIFLGNLDDDRVKFLETLSGMCATTQRSFLPVCQPVPTGASGTFFRGAS